MARPVPKRALIFGVSGQDGAYLADLLLGRGYQVFGTSRDAELSSFQCLEILGIRDRVTVLSSVPTDFRSVLQVITEVGPAEIYNLAAQSSVGLSFAQPVETVSSTLHGTLNILEAMRFSRLDARLYNASSGECFGDTDTSADENTPFRPASPYGVGKAAAHWAVANYRDSYGLFVCSGILFNHESPLRPARFVTQKIVRGALDIANGDSDSLRLGALNVSRDWGWAPEFVDAMHLMLQQTSPQDFVIATGETHSLEDFVDLAFDAVGLKASEHVVSDPSLYRPHDIHQSSGNPQKAKELLGWAAQKRMRDIVERLIRAESARRAGRIDRTLLL